MTKLEQKLIELGYNGLDYLKLCYCKNVENVHIDIWLNDDKLSINKNASGVQKRRLQNIRTQQDIDNLQQAFNQLQSDLKELKEYE